MSEVSTVSNLIMKLIGIAIVLGCAGTLGDRIFNMKDNATAAIKNDQLKYGAWNRQLLNPRIIGK